MSEGAGRMEEAQKGVKKNLNLNLQKDRVAGLLELQNGRACNLQNDRACSLQELQELELQMSVINRKNKMQNNSLAIKSSRKLLIKLTEQRIGSYTTGQKCQLWGWL